MSNPTGNGAGIRQTIISTIEAPRLRGVSTKHFIDFKKRRELYEKQIEEKNKDSATSIPLVSYKSSVENADLRLFIAARWVPVDTIEQITELHIRQCIQDRGHRLLDGEHLHLITEAIRPLAMKLNIVEAEDRVWTFHRDYLYLLEAAGYEQLPIAKPHIAIGHIMKRIRPASLSNRMKSVAKWRKDEGFEKKDFNNFMRELAKQAKKLEEEKPANNSIMDSSDSEKERHRPVERRNQRYTAMGTKNNDSKQATQPSNAQNPHTGTAPKENSRKRKRDEKDDLPPCLNEKCRQKGGRHFIQHCNNSDDATKQRLREEYRAAKRARTEKGKIATLTNSDDGRHHSALFSASFANGKVSCRLLADQGADVNLLPEELAERILKHGDYVVRKLPQPRTYKTVSGTVCARCENSITLDVHLKIRHGSNLILRNVTWEIPNGAVKEAILGRHVLEALGCDNRAMLQAASNLHDGDIDVRERLEKDREEEEGSIAALYGDSLYHTGLNEEDGLEKIEDQAEFGDNTQQEIDDALKKRIEEAMKAGLSAAGGTRLESMLTKHRAAFRLRLGRGGPAKVTPMKIVITPGKPPVRVKVRRYPTEQRTFLNNYLTKLAEFGLIKSDSKASWQAAPHLVPKGKSNWRITIDLRPINAATKSENWPMPNLESELADFSGSSHFASLDFCSAYWQLPLEAQSADACGIVAPQGAFVSTRVLHGLKNATSHFQSTIPPLFSDIQEHMKSWVDDFSLHAKTETELLKALESFLSTCVRFNLTLSAKKCSFYSKSIKWCGRIIDSSGYQLDPKNVEALRTMEMPVSADELCQFVHCCRWMSAAIPDFQKRCEPLTEALEAAYSLTGKRKKSALKNVPLSRVSWGAVHEVAFQDLQNALKEAVKLAFPKEGKAVCVFTDASDKFWAGIVSQVDPKELRKETSEQRHEPLAFLGGQFTGSQQNWTTYEKEAFSIVKVFDKLDFVLWGNNDVHVFTDHRNLLFVFAPLALRPNAPRYVLSKVHRWAIHLSRFDFSIEHIDGVKNVFADLLTRWSKGHRQVSAASGKVMALYQAIVPTAQETAWPDSTTIRNAQKKANTKSEACGKDGIWRLNGRIVIPNNATQLKLRILVAAHCGTAGHRGAEATKQKIAGEFIWPKLSNDAKEFTQQCIHCILSRTGEKVPRPLGQALHAQRPNEVVHMDFLYMGPSENNFKYVLLMKDDLSSFVQIFPAETPDAETAACSIAKWISTFGGMDWLVSDRGSHFTASLVAHLTEQARVRHHFTTAYCPWANGTVERLCKETIRTAKALLSEWKLSPTKWPTVLNSIQLIVNQSPLEKLGRNGNSPTWRTPLEVFTGRKPQPMLNQLTPTHELAKHTPIEAARAREISKLPDLQIALQEMHRAVAEGNEKRRTQAQRSHNAKTRVTPVNFDVGDFVLIRSKKAKTHKLTSGWSGPMRILRALSDLVFVVESLDRNDSETVHAQRMIRYPAVNTEEEINDQLREYAAFSEGSRFLVKSLLDVREKDGRTELLVSWKGWEDDEDSTWEPLDVIREDVPELVWNFLHEAGKRRLKEKILNIQF